MYKRQPWENENFSSVAQLVTYEATSPIPAERFDETLFSLLSERSHDRLPASVEMYLAQRQVQYGIIGSGIEATLHDRNALRTASVAYQSWGRPHAAAAISSALDAVETWSLNDYSTAGITRFLDTKPDLVSQIRKIEASATHEQWTANVERVSHVQEHRADFLKM